MNLLPDGVEDWLSALYVDSGMIRADTRSLIILLLCACRVARARPPATRRVKVQRKFERPNWRGRDAERDSEESGATNLEAERSRCWTSLQANTYCRAS